MPVLCRCPNQGTRSSTPPPRPGRPTGKEVSNERGFVQPPTRKHVPRADWCEGTREILQRIGCEHLWFSTRDARQPSPLGSRADWRKQLKERLWEQEQRWWLNERKTKPRLELYCPLKNHLQGVASYLHLLDRRGREEMVRLRSGANSLRRDSYRWNSQVQDCHCEVGVVEDAAHFFLHCPTYAAHRATLFSVAHRVFPGWSSLPDSKQLRFLLLPEGSTNVDLAFAVGNFARACLRIRQRIFAAT